MNKKTLWDKLLLRLLDKLNMLVKRNAAWEPKICPVCGKRNVYFKRLADYYWQKWDEAGFVHSIFQAETLNLQAFSCSHCSASDRARLFALYLKDKLKNTPDLKLLDFAPDSILTNRFLKHYSKIHYRTADLFMEGVDDCVDIQNMSIYSDDSWDVLICSHVLEHVPDDRKALQEIHRVLKPGAWAILMVPIFLDVQTTIELDSLSNKDELNRWKFLAQDDHVRMYAKQDFCTRITDAGFQLFQLDVNYFGAHAFHQHGIHPRSVLYVAQKNA